MIKSFSSLVDRHQKSEMVVAEIGCWQGETTIDYAKTVKLNNGKIIVVDWFMGNIDLPSSQHDGPHAYRPEKADQIYNNFMSNIKSIGCEDIVTVLRGNSHEQANLIKDESLDICFLDAGHQYSEIKKDISAYLPKIKKGGILCGHDCEDIKLANSFTEDELTKHTVRNVHPGVIQAVYDFFGYNIKQHADSIWEKI
jgi:hypothetical protein